MRWLQKNETKAVHLMNTHLLNGVRSLAFDRKVQINDISMAPS